MYFIPDDNDRALVDGTSIARAWEPGLLVGILSFHTKMMASSIQGHKCTLAVENMSIEKIGFLLPG
jgi:hypothetical protein